MATLDVSRKDVLYYPLSVTELSTSTGTNNVGVFANANNVLSPDSGTTQYGLPADGGIGVGVNGQSFFPIYNNQARYTPAKCEVDSCNGHVGQGGGQPHFHGDPFGTGAGSSQSGAKQCLYSPSNYTNGATDVHPPVIGFSFDGYLIYGRYLSASAPGFGAPPLDACGGHKHAIAGVDEHGLDLTKYHYHTQVFDATCGSGDMCNAGEAYVASTTGPYQCYKADLSAQEGSSALLGITSVATYRDKNSMSYRCCGMTDYYALTGVDVGASEVAASSKCSAPAPPTNGVYATGSACATQGASLLSGYRCHATCNEGYIAQGQTTCVKGTITEQAICVASAITTSTTNTNTASNTNTNAISNTNTTATITTTVTTTGASTSEASGSSDTSGNASGSSGTTAVNETEPLKVETSVTSSFDIGTATVAEFCADTGVQATQKTAMASVASTTADKITIVSCAAGRRLTLDRQYETILNGRDNTILNGQRETILNHGQDSQNGQVAMTDNLEKIRLLATTIIKIDFSVEVTGAAAARKLKTTLSASGVRVAMKTAINAGFATASFSNTKPKSTEPKLEGNPTVAALVVKNQAGTDVSSQVDSASTTGTPVTTTAAPAAANASYAERVTAHRVVVFFTGLTSLILG